MCMPQHRSQRAHALNRSAIGALVVGVVLSRDLLRGFFVWAEAMKLLCLVYFTLMLQDLRLRFGWIAGWP